MKQALRASSTLAIATFLSAPIVAHADLMGSPYGYAVNASINGSVFNSDYPLSGAGAVVVGQDFSAVAVLQAFADNFTRLQDFGGVVTFDIDATTITVGWSGSPQGIAGQDNVGLTFDFTNLDPGGIITGISLVSQSCTFGASVCSDFGFASFRTPGFTADSVTGMGVDFSGFPFDNQPTTTFSQTYDLTIRAAAPPSPAPEPATAALLGLGLLGMGLMSRRQAG